MRLLSGFHHVGITVADRDRSVAFWCEVLGVEPLSVRLLDGAYLSDITGYDGIHLDAAMLPLPGGGRLEILQYLLDDRAANSEATANVGNVHICLQTDDIDEQFRRAVAAGARPSARAGRRHNQPERRGTSRLPARSRRHHPGVIQVPLGLTWRTEGDRIGR